MVEAPVKLVLFAGDGPTEFIVDLPVACVNAAIADHFIMLIRDMSDKAFDEFHDRNGLFYVLFILVTVVVEGNKFTVILIDPGSGNYRTAEITPDIFYDFFWVAFVRFGVDVEAFGVFPVATGFYLFEGRADLSLHFVEEGGAESVAQESVIKIVDVAPETVIAVSAFRNKAVDMRIPLQIPAKGVENHDKTWGEVQGLILFEKHA